MITRVSAALLALLMLLASSPWSFAQDNNSRSESAEPAAGGQRKNATAATAARAQPPLPTPKTVGWCNMPWKFRGPWLSGGSRYQLILAPVVQEELGIRDDQKEKILGSRLSRVESEILSLEINIHMRWITEEQAGRRAEGKLCQDGLKRILEAELKKILKADQERRLDEIALRQAGPLVIAHPEIARRLGLSRGQIKELDELLAETKEKNKISRDSISKGARPLKPVDGPMDEDQYNELQAWIDRSRAVAKVNHQSEAKLAESILALLKPSQKEKLDRMLGEFFDLGPLTTMSGEPPAIKDSRP